MNDRKNRLNRLKTRFRNSFKNDSNNNLRYKDIMF